MAMPPTTKAVETTLRRMLGRIGVGLGRIRRQGADREKTLGRNERPHATVQVEG
jgi:hypothetical protein